MKTVLILGAGTSGTVVANRLSTRLGEAWEVVVADPSDRHTFQPAIALIPFGGSETGVTHLRAETLSPRVQWKEATVSEVLPEVQKVAFVGGEMLHYDLLVIASGAHPRPDLTEGMLGDCWRTSVFDFTTLPGAIALREALQSFRGGRFVSNVVQLPVRAPIAPVELLFLADDCFRSRDIRNRVELVYVTPADHLFPQPAVAARLASLLGEKDIKIERGVQTSAVDGARRVIRTTTGREIHYDLLATVPAHSGADFVARSGIGDANGFIPTNPSTLAARNLPNVFVVGDATDLDVPKLPSVAHFEAEALVANVVAAAKGNALEPIFDGHTTELIETGGGKAVFVDFTDSEGPLAGGYPLPGIGPFTMLEETRRNHAGRSSLQWLYWNAILPGRPLPLGGSTPPRSASPVPPTVS